LHALIVFGLSKPVAEVAATGGGYLGGWGSCKFMDGDKVRGKYLMLLSGVPRGKNEPDFVLSVLGFLSFLLLMAN
jgi:hypothetical protein